MKKRIFVIDGYGQIYRSYFAFFSNPLKDKNGNNVSAVFGFFNNLMMLIHKYNPDYVVVALDSKGKTFRHDMFPEYKANREKTPEDLHAQIPVIVNMLDAMNIRHYERVGMEADDIIATIASNCTKLGLETVMVTGDKDLMQLVNDNVFALRPPRKGEHEYRLCNSSDVQQIFSVRPDQICDYLTILGDASDNVPGINGIGEKGAVKLLQQYDTLSNAYQHLDEMSAGIRTKLENAKDHLELSHKLIELKNDLFSEDEINLADYEVKSISWVNAIQEFYSIGSESLVRTAKRFIDPSFVPNIPSSSKPSEKPETEEKISPMPDDFKVDSDFDVKLAAWLLDSSLSEPDLSFICEKYTGNSDYENKDNMKNLVWTLSQKLKAKGLEDIFCNIEIPLSKVLSEMEKEGILLDGSKLKQFEEDLNKEILMLETDIYTVCGHEFNIGSPKQLQQVLFSERGLEPVKKTKSGYSTDSEVLETLVLTSDDPVPAMILRYRALTKLLSTYVITLPTLTDENGRIHTTFVQTGTATGRLSSKNPNLQNIPVRTEEGRKIRSAFVAKDGCVLVSADYSQIELAVLAGMSKDKSLCDAFINGEDVHTKTAALIFSEFPQMVTPDQRRIAKTINFGVIYGMSAFRLSRELKISRKDAQQFIDRYFETYSGISSFIEKIKEDASKNLEVRTMLGHIRAVPEMASNNKNIRSAAERVAVNTVIQGTAAEIVKKAMLSVSNAIKDNNLQSKMLLQVHDEIIFEVPLQEKEKLISIVKECMENVNLLSVPLRVSIESAKSWGEIH